MAYKYIGDSTLGVGLTVTAAKPLDNRTVVEDIKNLYTIPKSSAYQGMTVANIQDGNIYMLIDKEKISEKTGWKASYESLLIITCSLEEYDAWKNNTTPEYTPKNPELPYIYPNTYYYIYERDDDQYYLSAGWGKQIETLLRTKASESSVNALNDKLTKLDENLTANYSTTETITNTYVPKTDINLEDPESFLSTTLAKYYTIIDADAKFVTKDDLRGGGEEGTEGDDFVFVTKTLYNKDLEVVNKTLETTLKTDADGSLNSITVGLIKSKLGAEGAQLVVDVKDSGLYIGEDPLAKKSEVPLIVTLSAKDYEKLELEQTIDSGTYYYVYDVENENLAYVTNDYLSKNYDNRGQYQEWCVSKFYSKNYINTELITDLDLCTKTVADATYLKIATAESDYATKQSVETLSTDLTTNYVTKKELTGSSEGSDYIFVEKKVYDVDKQNFLEELDKTLKVDGLGSLDTITVGHIKSPDQQLTVDVTNKGLSINDDLLALQSSVPKIVTLSETEYNQLEENLQIKEDTYYYIYDISNKDLIYVTKVYLKEQYHSIVEYLAWVSKYFYTQEALDLKLSEKADKKLYYTSEVSDLKYLSITNAQSTYATLEALNTLDSTIKANYVTKEDLKGSATEGDDDFIFVTLTKYDTDKLSLAESIITKTLNTTNTKTTNLELNKVPVKFEENYLVVNSEKIAPLKEVPKIICLTDTAYESLELKLPDTYYYTYSAEHEKDNGYVTYKYVDETYYKKAQVEQYVVDTVKPLKALIATLELQVRELTQIILSWQPELPQVHAMSNNTKIFNTQMIFNNE